MDVQYYRHNSTGSTDMHPGHRFELHYDQHSYRPNRPINARLHQFSQSHGQRSPSSSVPTSPQSGTTLSRTGLGSSNNHSGLLSGSPIFQRAPSIARKELSRSVSMPLLTHKSDRSHDTGNSTSRKNSLVSNCTHSSSRGHSISSDFGGSVDYTTTGMDTGILSEINHGTSDHPKDGTCSCHRHHHRRGSVAIKFEEKKIVNIDEDEGIDKSDMDPFQPGDATQYFNESVFEN